MPGLPHKNPGMATPSRLRSQALKANTFTSSRPCQRSTSCSLACTSFKICTEKTCQDWPGIGQSLDQHILKGDGVMSQQGRIASQALLAWGKLHRFADAAGNVWLLCPTLKLKVDWQRPKNKKIEGLQATCTVRPFFRCSQVFC